jgi:DNA mismatch endonuclease (patch repair protein)
MGQTVNQVSEVDSYRMSCVRNRDTRPEMTVRRLLHSMGYRYRVHAKDLPGSPDVVVRKRRQAIFVNGCFWHFHECPECRLPEKRRDFWLPKLRANKDRDQRNLLLLRAKGWNVLTIWECELDDLDVLATRLRDFMECRD